MAEDITGFPELHGLDLRELTATVAGAVATAGTLLEKRAVDCVIDYEGDVGSLGLYGEGSVSLMGITIPGRHHDDFVLRTNFGKATASCGVRSHDGTTRSQQWLTQGPDGGLLLASDRSSDGDDPQSTSLHDGVRELLGTVQQGASQLEATPWELMDAHPGERGPIAINSYPLIPVVGAVIRDIGKVMAADLSELNRSASADVRVGLNSWGGRVYGLPRRQQTVTLEAHDYEGGRGAKFTLQFKHLGPKDRGEVVLIEQCTLREEDRTGDRMVITKETLTQRGKQLRVIREQQVVGDQLGEPVVEDAPHDAIATMAGKVVKLALEGARSR